MVGVRRRDACTSRQHAGPPIGRRPHAARAPQPVVPRGRAVSSRSRGSTQALCTGLVSPLVSLRSCWIHCEESASQTSGRSASGRPNRSTASAAGPRRHLHDGADPVRPRLARPVRTSVPQDRGDARRGCHPDRLVPGTGLVLARGSPAVDPVTTTTSDVRRRHAVTHRTGAPPTGRSAFLLAERAPSGRTVTSGHDPPQPVVRLSCTPTTRSPYSSRSGRQAQVRTGYESIRTSSPGVVAGVVAGVASSLGGGCLRVTNSARAVDD